MQQPADLNAGDIESQIPGADPYNGTHLHYKIEPVGAPQRLSLSLAVKTSSREMHLRISGEIDEEMRFEWQMWKDAFIGRMVGQSEWRDTRLGIENEELQSEAALSSLATL